MMADGGAGKIRLSGKVACQVCNAPGGTVKSGDEEQSNANVWVYRPCVDNVPSSSG
jgi:hypothetical protein